MTPAPYDDPLWPTFKPLWSELRQAGDSLFVVGGYGLFLKQYWLGEHRDTQTIVGLEHWLEPAPRVTKDVDIVLSLDLIGSAESQRKLSETLNNQGFQEVDPRWQFRKTIEGRTTVVEFHAQEPDLNHKYVDVQGYHVRHKPSLGKNGIHGRENPEAIGSELSPFKFEIEGMDICVPNPITLAMMKLVAMRDRWNHSYDMQKNEENREFHQMQATKHAHDVCRAIALTTINERDQIGNILQQINTLQPYQVAAQIRSQYFTMQAKGTRTVGSKWRSEDIDLIINMLAQWFP